MVFGVDNMTRSWKCSFAWITSGPRWTWIIERMLQATSMSRLNILACRTIVGNLRRQRTPKGGVRLYVARRAAARATYLRASLLRDHLAGVDCGAILPTRDTAGTRQQAQAQPEPCPISLPASSGWSYCSQLLPWERL